MMLWKIDPGLKTPSKDVGNWKNHYEAMCAYIFVTALCCTLDNNFLYDALDFH